MNSPAQGAPIAGVSEPPLCVDLDGTLVCSDLLLESFFALLSRSPLYVLLLPLWLWHGKAYLKRQIAARVELDIAVLPYHRPFLRYLKREHQRGRRLILVTAADQKFASQVAGYLGIFQETLASDEGQNLAGATKAAALVERWGSGGFDYAGNATPDREIWAQCRAVILVNPSRRARAYASADGRVARTFENRAHTLKHWIRMLRLHQWVKNGLVFVPLVAAHLWTSAPSLSLALCAFLAFGLCASSVYMLNDLLDLPSDRHHHKKRFRPFAGGAIAISTGILLVPVLLLGAFSLALLLLPGAFAAVLASYFVLTLAYSLRLKRVVLLDVLTLAGLYTVRILAGAAAIAVVPSFWLLAFSIFVFLSLGMVKRYSELLVAVNEGNHSTRGYRPVDLESLTSLGTASGYLAVLVLALYIDSDNIQRVYGHPGVIWLICPLLLYWISRVWLLARRGEMHYDPVVFALRDRTSMIIGLLCLVILILAR